MVSARKPPRDALLEHLIAAQGGRCERCRRPLAVADAHVAHRKPLSRGGLDVPENRFAAHARCNMREGARYICTCGAPLYQLTYQSRDGTKGHADRISAPYKYCERCDQAHRNAA